MPRPYNFGLMAPSISANYNLFHAFFWGIFGGWLGGSANDYAYTSVTSMIE
jgi:hypothetical protein